jgi:hypothetical protein
MFCSRGLKGNGLESEVAAVNLFGLAMTGRGGLIGPEELDEVEPGFGEDGGRSGRLCGGGSMVARESRPCCEVCVIELSSCRVLLCSYRVVAKMLSGQRRV